MSYCGHYQAAGAWPCTIHEGGDGMPDLLRLARLTESALRAYEAGADRDQLSQYLEAIHAGLLGGEDADPGEAAPRTAAEAVGGETDDAAPGDADAAAPPRLPPG